MIVFLRELRLTNLSSCQSRSIAPEPTSLPYPTISGSYAAQISVRQNRHCRNLDAELSAFNLKNYTAQTVWVCATLAHFLGLLQSPNISVKYFSDFYISYWDEEFLDMRVKDLCVYHAFDAYRRAYPLRPDELMVEVLFPWLKGY
jgi:hypothetical protein